MDNLRSRAGEDQSCHLNAAIERCREGQAELNQRLIRALGRLERLQCRVEVGGMDGRQQHLGHHQGRQLQHQHDAAYGAAAGRQFQSRPLFDQARCVVCL